MGFTPINISTPNDGNGDPLRDAFNKVNVMLEELYNTKVSKVFGKGLSTNDFTNTLKTKLDGIQAGAEVNVQSDWAQTDDTQDDFIKNKTAVFAPFNGVSFVIRVQAVAGVLQSDELIDATIIAIAADGQYFADWETNLPDIVFNPITGDVTGITAFPDSLIIFNYTKSL